MKYSVGSLADLVSGFDTPNKPKVHQKKVKSPRKKEKKQIKEDAGTDAGSPRERKNLITPNKAKGKKRSLSAGSIEEQENASIKSPKKWKMLNSEQTEENEQVGNANESNAQRRIDKKAMNEQKQETRLHPERTLFVGNVPISTTRRKLQKLFEKYGKVETVRFRCAPIADGRTPKRVAVIKKEFHPDRKSIHSYVRFATREDALKALELNGFTYMDLHLRVNMCDQTEKPDQKKSIFVGNVPFDAEEEDLWKLFESCGEIESVRLVRDFFRNVGKGFGYVNFKSSDAAELALQMQEVHLKKRELRISPCKTSVAKKSPRKLKEKKATINRGTKQNPKKLKTKKAFKKGGDKNVTGPTDLTSNLKSVKVEQKNFQGKKVSDEKKKKKFNKGANQKRKLISKIAPR